MLIFYVCSILFSLLLSSYKVYTEYKEDLIRKANKRHYRIVTFSYLVVVFIVTLIPFINILSAINDLTLTPLWDKLTNMVKK